MLYSYAEKTGDYLRPEKGSVEHILPESYGEYALNIGNLIALEDNINHDCDSMEYADKIKEYERSKYVCVKEFIEKHKEWSKDEIDERAKEMAKTMYHILKM